MASHSAQPGNLPRQLPQAIGGASLRLRVSAAIVTALVGSLAVGAGLALVHAGRSVRAEVLPALQTAGAELATTLALAPGADQAALTRVVRSFDGSRHVRLLLLDRGSPGRPAQVLAASVHPLDGRPPA